MKTIQTTENQDVKYAVSYSRVSTSAQDTARQEEEIRKYCTFKGLTLNKPQEFVEKESGLHEVREALTAMMNYCKVNPVHTVIVHELSRLGRTQEVLNTVDFLKGLRINLHSMAENIDTIDANGSDNTMAKLVIGIMSSINEVEIQTKNFRSKSGKKRVARLGAANHGGTQPFGYMKVAKMLVIDEDEAAVVRRIYDLYLSGRGTRQIAALFISEGQLTKKGKEWYDTQVNDVLTNPIYCGYRKLTSKENDVEFAGRTFKNAELIELPQLAIISVEDFTKANAILKSNMNKLDFGRKHEIVLNKRIITCGVCGKPYFGAISAKAYTNNYMCTSRKTPKPCGNHSINIAKLDAAVIKNIEYYFPAQVVEQLDITYFAQQIELKKSLILDLKLEQKNLENKYEAINKIFENGRYTESQWIAKMKEVDVQKLSFDLKIFKSEQEVYNLEYQMNIPVYSEINKDVLHQLIQSLTISPAKGVELSRNDDKAIQVTMVVLGQKLTWLMSQKTDMNTVIYN